MADIPDYRRPPKQPSAALAQYRNWFLFHLDGEPMVFRRKAIWFTVPDENVRQFVGDDFEPMGNMLSAKMPDGVADIFKAAWTEHQNPPLALV